MVRQVAKPVNGVIPLNGKAADWLSEYLEKTEPDVEAQEAQAREDAEFIARKTKELRAR